MSINIQIQKRLESSETYKCIFYHKTTPRKIHDMLIILMLIIMIFMVILMFTLKLVCIMKLPCKFSMGRLKLGRITV